MYRRDTIRIFRNHLADKPANFSNYSFYCRTAEEVNGIHHGGVGILVENGIPHKLCQLNTNLQATALRITCHKTITVGAYVPYISLHLLNSTVLILMI